MAPSGDLIDFDVIEGQKENIQALPSGRSAKKLAEIYSPSPLQKLSTPTPTDTRNVNDCIRAEYEAEVQNISESDDPLDVFDRYVRWTLDAYPSAQATPQSQLHSLLERATKAFVSSTQYKNDPRYLKMWMHYIHFFADDPRETYVFLSRHAIGERLALFYEEFAAWLEGAGRWAQAEEVYRMGIEREARPVQRLMRKFKEFEQRLAEQPDGADKPSSPALPTVRPALAAKLDPFSSARTSDSQSQRAGSGSGASKPAKSKMTIFSDADAKPSALSSRDAGSKGWDTIGSMAERKKENTVQPTPWAGETLHAGGKKSSTAKMAVFRDPSLSRINNIVVVPSKNQITVHPQTGKRERIFVDLATLYPTPEEPGTELSFEEVLAARRGWLDHSWEEEVVDVNLVPEPMELGEIEEISKGVGEKLTIHRDGPILDENGAAMEPQRPTHVAKKKKIEVNETQIIKAKLDSPSGPKLKKKINSEPTMTLHTRAATDDIYEIFNAPLKPAQDEASADEDDYETEGDYTTDAESNGTTRNVDNEIAEPNDDADDDDRSESGWSDFDAHKHVPGVGRDADADAAHNETQMSDMVDDAAASDHEREETLSRTAAEDRGYQDEDPETPEEHLSRSRTSFVPIPPEDFDPPTRPYRDPAEVANSRLPFMTPITERTEVSLEVDVERRAQQYKTPCKNEETSAVLEDNETSDLEPMSSPIRDIISPEKLVSKSSGPLAPKPAFALTKVALTKGASRQGAAGAAAPPPKGPIVMDLLCNPVGEEVRHEILTNMQPPLQAYPGFFDHRHDKYENGADIRKFAKALHKQGRGGSDRGGSLPAPVIIEFPDVVATYTVKRELGAGAFAPVYLVENSDPDSDAAGNDENAVVAMGKGSFAVNHRHSLEALKMEVPPTPWEFHMMRVAHKRLGAQHRASASLSYAHEMHLYQDEAFLFLPYHANGTLLDVVNHFRAEPSGVMDEQLAMFFTIELLRTVEALHSKSVMHGDIKPDNCLLRLDGIAADPYHETQGHQKPLSSQWQADGSGGWDARGLTLIDFGRAIDMRAFPADVQFIADWKTTSQDCSEMREGRSWTWQIDYHGLAGTIHCLLFGKYIETMRCDQGGIGIGGRKYRTRESLKRYWQTDIWGECFDVLLNPGSHLDAADGGRMPVLRPMRRVRERMEQWLATNCEKGVGLKSLIGRLEAFAKGRRH